MEYDENEPLFDIDNRGSRIWFSMMTLGASLVAIFIFSPFHTITSRIFATLILWGCLYNFYASIELRRVLDKERARYAAQLIFMGVDEEKSKYMRRQMAITYEILKAPYAAPESQEVKQSLDIASSENIFPPA